MTDSVVYACMDTSVIWSRGMTPLARGDVWDAEAEIVAERPDLFSDEPTLVRGREAKPAPPQEPEEQQEPAAEDAAKGKRSAPPGTRGR